MVRAICTYTLTGELAVCGCTVRVHDYNPINMQTVHSRIAEQLEELRQDGLLPHGYQLPVRAHTFHRTVSPMLRAIPDVISIPSIIGRVNICTQN